MRIRIHPSTCQHVKERKRRHLSIARDAAETGTNPHESGTNPARARRARRSPAASRRLAREPPGARGGFVPMPRNAHA
ncbi:hypothetical protein BURPS305_1386 [Burkholderia pseudomallei 305]|nr:hypothetical protein BURPS305_1386 [Burkholderia pseudomallei 305]